ncbi:MAG: site-2 protease family protein, partial [Clostridia bacterium]
IDKILEKNNGEEINLTLERNNEQIEMTLTPTLEENENTTRKYYLGIIFKVAPKSFTGNLYYGFWDTVEFSVSIIDNVKQLFTGNVGVDQLTGPVGISEVVVKTENTSQFIYILALISLSLGVTNLLPVPPLDGGKILLVLIEAIIRRPIKENINVAIQMTGFFLIMGLAIIVTYNDVLRIF